MSADLDFRDHNIGKMTNHFVSTYELGKVIGAKEEQLRLIKLIKNLGTSEDEIGTFVYVSDLLTYLEENLDKKEN